MPAENFFIYAIFGLVIGIVLFFKGFKEWSLKRLIENTPTSTIRSIAMGFVEIAGNVAKPLNNFLKGPFTGKDCVYYKYEIEEQRRNKNGTYWAAIESGFNAVPFYVQDKTGTVLVDSKDAKIELPSDSQITPGKIPSQIKTFCEANKIATTTLFWNRTLRFTEYNLAPNNKIYVLGTAGDNPFVKEATAVKGVEDVMIQKGKKPFYISDQSEKDVLKLFAWKAYGGVYGGGAIFSVSLGIFLWSIGAW